MAIQKGKKRIVVTLNQDTLKMCDDWDWMRPSWSYWVNLGLQLLMKTLNENNPVAKVRKDQNNDRTK